MKNRGYVIGLVIGIPLFILIVNFLFFRGNNPKEVEILIYIQNSNNDTIEVKSVLPKAEQYISGISRRNNPSSFLLKYTTFSKKYNKHFVMLIFYPFDENSINRRRLIGGEGADEINQIIVKVNKNQLLNSKFGTKQNPIPVFPVDMLNLNWKESGYQSDPFHVSEKTNFLFVEQYLKFFMPKEEFKKMFRK